MTSNYESALAWARRGYNVVPQAASGKKHPDVKWKDLQTRPVAEAELAQWESMFANGGAHRWSALSTRASRIELSANVRQRSGAGFPYNFRIAPELRRKD
jgi:hypothetical protein